MQSPTYALHVLAFLSCFFNLGLLSSWACTVLLGKSNGPDPIHFGAGYYRGREKNGWRGRPREGYRRAIEAPECPKSIPRHPATSPPPFPTSISRSHPSLYLCSPFSEEGRALKIPTIAGHWWPFPLLPSPSHFLSFHLSCFIFTSVLNWMHEPHQWLLVWFGTPQTIQFKTIWQTLITNIHYMYPLTNTKNLLSYKIGLSILVIRAGNE